MGSHAIRICHCHEVQRRSRKTGQETRLPRQHEKGGGYANVHVEYSGRIDLSIGNNGSKIRTSFGNRQVIQIAPIGRRARDLEEWIWGTRCGEEA